MLDQKADHSPELQVSLLQFLDAGRLLFHGCITVVQLFLGVFLFRFTSYIQFWKLVDLRLHFAVVFELVGIVGLQIIADRLALIIVQWQRKRHLFFFDEMVDRVLYIEFKGLFFREVVRKFAIVLEKAVGEDRLLKEIVNGQVLLISKIHKLKIYQQAVVSSIKQEEQVYILLQLCPLHYILLGSPDHQTQAISPFWVGPLDSPVKWKKLHNSFKSRKMPFWGVWLNLD